MNDTGLTITPYHCKSTAIGAQTGIYMAAKNNIFIGYESGFNTRTSDNILIGVEIDGSGNEIKIGDEQEKVTIGVYDLAEMIQRIRYLEGELNTLREDCFAPGGPIARVAKERFNILAGISDGNKSDGNTSDEKSDERNELKGLDQ